jgi:hypothetical protein
VYQLKWQGSVTFIHVIRGKGFNSQQSAGDNKIEHQNVSMSIKLSPPLKSYKKNHPEPAVVVVVRSFLKFYY